MPRPILLIAGGSRGIGASTARLAAERGYDVAINFLKNENAAAKTAEAVKSAGGKAVTLQGDMAKEADIIRVFDETAGALGPTTHFVHSAGIGGKNSRLDAASAATIREVLDVNLFGALICSREAVRRMSTANGGNGGAIVLLSSIASVTGGATEYVFYAAAKGGVDALTNGLAREVAKEGIRVNAIRPGPTDTEIHEPGRLAPHHAAAADGTAGSAGRDRRSGAVSAVGRRVLHLRRRAQCLRRALIEPPCVQHSAAYDPCRFLVRTCSKERKMVAAVRVHKVGGPEVLTYDDIDVPAPGQGQVRVKQHASGVNFIDCYFRMGLYPSPVGLPFVAGNEAAGEVVAVGPGVTDLKVGDRVAYVVALGCYAAERLVPADRAVKLPANISYEQAAAMMLKGMTAEYLVHRTFKVEKGMNVLIHAAAGGVGLILCQWANHLGANVVGTVGSKDKAALAKANGCHHTILYRDEDFVARVKEITGGKLCSVVYDGIGKTTFPASLDCIAPLGMFVSFGSASGQIDAFNINILQTKGSLFATRPTLNTYAAKREDLLSIAKGLFDVVGTGAVKIPINQKYALKDAAKAHRDLESRATTGSSILLP